MVTFGSEEVCDATVCKDRSGNACTPVDADENGLVDDCVIADASTDPFPGTNLSGQSIAMSDHRLSVRCDGRC